MLLSFVVWCVVWAMMLHLDREMLCNERVGSWMVVNMWWYEQGGSYPVTFTWGYERGRFVCSVLTSERCHVRGGTGLVNHMCWTTTSAGRAFGSGYFCHFAPVLEPRHIRTRPKRLAFCLGSQPKQKLHILPRFCWEPRPYVLLCPSSPPETLGSHHGYTTTPSTTARSETQNERSVVTAVFSFIVRAIFESCNYHGTSMFFIHKNVNITLA